MNKYLVVVEKTADGYSAFAPDVPGVVGVGDTVEGTLENMKAGLELYVEFSIEKGEPVAGVNAVEAVFIDVEVPTAATVA